jgi:hypothetical protein
MLILAWNFADEIVAQQSDFKAAGGKIVIPFPKPVSKFLAARLI